ncbi:segregation and condensation protein A [Parathalassolituus penaei]|uniref:Segregation and condensation protein A n=1 Tax=Parathalassolituus penaei TaxID=2997323 RepID=A0A9X3EGZ1_9GAMM|nr:ScpA family protein [Parathalassolituus penaei]MCY0964141.1 ScpA family protein [Parathalassolituus penaei]
MTDTIEPQSTDEALAVIDLPTPIARVMGQPMTQLPLDLYIPPDALEVILEQFEGPLDLLLYLIRKQNLDILDVNVTDIVDQYMQYIDMMNAMQLELAGEYLLMAATLAEIKSRVLLPRHRDDDHEVIDDEDPRAELIRRLQEYERFKQAAEDLEALPREERDNVTLHLDIDNRQINRTPPDVSMREIMLAMAEVLRRAERTEHHEIQRETLSTRERMIQIIDQLQSGEFKPLTSLIGEREGRLGVVVTFLAILELVKEKTLELVQQEAFGPIHVRLRAVE